MPGRVCWVSLCSIQVNIFDLDLKHMKPAAKNAASTPCMMLHNSKSKLNLLLKSYKLKLLSCHTNLGKMQENMLEFFNFYENAGDFP